MPFTNEFGDVMTRTDGLRLRMILFVMAALTGILLVVIYGGISQVRESSVHNSLRQIALAINEFEKEHGCYPPVNLLDENGKPLHSWRVLILPFLGEQELYDQFDLGQPWDAPTNAKLIEKMPGVYRNSSSDGLGETPFEVVVGSSTLWPSSAVRTRAELTGHSVGIVVEAPNTTVWTKPSDLNLDDFLEAAEGTKPMRFVYENGHTGELPRDRELAERLFTLVN